MSLDHKISVGIVGGAGYTAGELMRILINHIDVDIQFLQSDSQVGKPITTIHKDLVGDTEMIFTDQLLPVDVLFLCRGHGASKAFLEKTPISADTKIIDLSHDYRLKSKGNDFVYGLPEAYRNEITNANKLANPGCFATCIQLGLLPLAKKGKLNDSVHVTAITGSTGAGQSLSETSHFSWRNNNVSVYKPFNHQHLDEIRQTLGDVQHEQLPEINFIPVRGNFTRGIFASIYLNSDLTPDEVNYIFIDYYKDHPFVNVTNENPDMKQVVGTNKALVRVQKIENKVFVTCMIDNLIKGASGQAVQNMNLMFGLEETSGLRLKSIGF
ncbi:MAG: N-acetyl-gamma-glutamyl-phosphate reductase [Bacteroidetes bacterium]|nr:N-acetyl-gamma-glutamyl-phosphate reductase [Bacteroidota bacterium]MDA1120036.1 N-acetyl-gamma-glutamyl-phosphate reductase [Bacteroidota bacterium]